MKMNLSRSVFLSDSTNITFSKSHLDLGLNSYSGSLSLENETILSQNSNISISKILNSKSFLERVKSIQSNESNSSGIFRVGALNQMKLKKKGKKNDSMSDCSIPLCKEKENENLNQSFGNKNKTSISSNVDESESLTLTLGQTTNGKIKSNLVKNGIKRNPNIGRVSVHFQCDSVDSSSTYNEPSLLAENKEITSENVGRVLRRSKRNNVSVNFSSVSDLSSDIQESGKSSFNESNNLSNELKNSSSQKLSRKRKYVRDQNVSVQLQEDPSSSGNSVELELESKEILSKEDSEKFSLSQCKDIDNRCTSLNKENSKCYSNSTSLGDTVERRFSRETRSQNIKKNSTKSKHNKKNVSVDFNLSNLDIESSTSVSELASVEQTIDEATLDKNIEKVKNLTYLSSDICELNSSHIKPTITTETDSCGIPCVKNTEQCIPIHFNSGKDAIELPTTSTDFTGEDQKILASKCSEEAVQEPHTLSNIENSETLNSKKFLVNELKTRDKNISVPFSTSTDNFYTFTKDNTEVNEKITFNKKNCETSIQTSLPLQDSGVLQCQEHTVESCNPDELQILKKHVSVRFSSDMDTSQLFANGPDFTKTSNGLENAAQSKDVDSMQNSLEKTNQSKKCVTSRDGGEVSGNCENMLVPNTVADKECSSLLKETQNKDNGDKENINATFIIENRNMDQSVDDHSVKMINKELEVKDSSANNYQGAAECSNINTTYTIPTQKSKIPVFKGTKNKKETVNLELQNRNEVIIQEVDINDVRFSEDRHSVDNLRCQPCDSELIGLQNLSMEPVVNPKISLQSDLCLDSFDSQISDNQNNSLEIYQSLSLTNVISNACQTKCEKNEKKVHTNCREMNGVLSNRVSSTSEAPSEIILHQHSSPLASNKMEDLHPERASLNVNGIENVTLSGGQEDLPDSILVINKKQILESQIPYVPKITVVNEDNSRKHTSFKSRPISAINKSQEIQDPSFHLRDSSVTKIISELPVTPLVDSDQKRCITGEISDKITVPKINKDISHSSSAKENVETIGPRSEETSSDCSSNENVAQESPNWPEIQNVLPTTTSSDKPQDIVESSIQQRDLSITNGSNSRTSKDSQRTKNKKTSSSSSIPRDISERIDSKSPVQNTATNTTAMKCISDEIPVSDCDKNVSHATYVEKNALKIVCPNSEMSSNCSSTSNMPQEGSHPSDIQNILPPTTFSSDEPQEIVEPSTQRKALSTTNDLDGTSDDAQMIEGKKTSSSSSVPTDISERIGSQNTASKTTDVKCISDEIPVSDCEKNVSHATHVGNNALKMVCPDSEISSNCSSTSNMLQKGSHPSDIQNILPPTTFSSDKPQEIVEPSTQQKALSTTNDLDGTTDDTQMIKGKKTRDISERKKSESVILKFQLNPTSIENISNPIPVPNNEYVLSHSTSASHRISDSEVPKTPIIARSVSDTMQLTSDENFTENMIKETEKSLTSVATSIQKNVSRTGKGSMENSQGLHALSTKNILQVREVQNDLSDKKIPHSKKKKEALEIERVVSNVVINEARNDQTTNIIGKNGKKLTDDSQKHSVTTQVTESQPSLSSGVKQIELRGKRKSVTFASTVQLKNHSRTEEISLTSSPVSNFKRKRSRNSNARSSINQTANSDFEISMTVPLSHISFDDKSNECRTKGHSTPLKDKEHKNEINNKENEPVDDHLFAVPLNKTQVKSFGSSVSDRKRKESTSDESGDNMSKRRKTIDKTIDDLSNDNLLDVSEIPLDKTIAQKKLIYHSTPIGSVVERKIRVSGKAKKPRNDCKDKNIQVSKSLFGTSSEGTTAISSKKSRDGLSTSYSYSGSLRRSNRISSLQKSVSVNKLLQSKDNSDTSRINYKINIDSMSGTSLSKLISTTSTGNIASNEESPTIRNFYSTNKTISTLSRSRTVDSEHLEVSPKRVCFRSFPSHIDSVTNSLSSRSYHSVCVTLNEEDSLINSHSEIQPSMGNSISLQNDKSSVHSEIDINMNEGSGDAFDMNVSEKITVMASPSEITQYSEVSLPTPAAKSFFRHRYKLSMSKEVRNKEDSILPLQTSRPHSKHNYQLDQHFDIEGKPYIPPKINFGVHVPPSFLNFCKNKLELIYGLESSIIAQRLISNLDATISAVKVLNTADEVNFHTLVLRNILNKYDICKTVIEYCTLVMKYTPFDFQKKVLPLGGYYGGLKKKLVNVRVDSPIITTDELLKTS